MWRPAGPLCCRRRFFTSHWAPRERPCNTIAREPPPSGPSWRSVSPRRSRSPSSWRAWPGKSCAKCLLRRRRCERRSSYADDRFSSLGPARADVVILTDPAHRGGGGVEGEDDGAASRSRSEVSGQKESRHARGEGLREPGTRTVELDADGFQEVLRCRAAQGVDHAIDFQRIERRLREAGAELLPRRFEGRNVRGEQDSKFPLTLERQDAVAVDRVGAVDRLASIGERDPVALLDQELAILHRGVAASHD